MVIPKISNLGFEWRLWSIKINLHIFQPVGRQGVTLTKWWLRYYVVACEWVTANMERKNTKYPLNFGLQFLHIQPPTRCFWRYSNWHVFPSPLPAKLSFSACELKALREARDMIPSAACNRVARVGRFAKLIFVSHVASLGSKACNSFTSLPCLATLARKSSPKLRRATTACRS